ncbi:MAG: M20/M25/M40 family metallo-hydrolase [Bryobacteraceae bacterium]|jgi:acetylornithine deacetylase/succinyl-diaminopimelate desuccinylase-like protein
MLVLLLGVQLQGQQNERSASDARASARPLARDLLRELVEINTTPAFGCTKAAEAMAARLRSVGFPDSDVVMAGARPEKQNLVARLRGGGKAKPILLIAHLDVVDAPRDGWAAGLDPFHLTERDGFFYGRGVLDVKHGVAALVANLMRLRAEGFVPGRDIVVALTADEEGGGANGVYWLISNHRDWIDAAYCLNLDAGGGQADKGRRVRMTVQTSEKSNISFRAETKSQGGHSSLPVKDNAIYRLAAGLTRLAGHDFPFRFNETTRAYFERMSAAESGAAAADMKAVSKDPADLEAAKRLADGSPYYNSILRTTCVATRIEGGHAANALPQTASAVINCRVFPGDTAGFVRDTLAGFMADGEIALTLMSANPPAPASPMLPEVMGAVERLTGEMWPGMPVYPVMDPWASDSISLRRAGMPTFGVSGTFGELDLGNAHGANERLPVDAFYESVEFLYRLMKMLAR